MKKNQAASMLSTDANRAGRSPVKKAASNTAGKEGEEREARGQHPHQREWSAKRHQKQQRCERIARQRRQGQEPLRQHGDSA